MIAVWPMAIWGKIFGSATGLALGGPLGALLGLALGAAVDDRSVRRIRGGDPTQNVGFTIGVIALAAKMARADGHVAAEEVAAFRQVFRVPEAEMPMVSRVFNMAQQDTAGYGAYARQIKTLLGENHLVLTDLLDGLFYIALSDGHLHPLEKEYLANVARIFGFDDREFAAMFARHMGADDTGPYAVLGVAPDISDMDLRAAYHRLVKASHPDRLMAEGVPSEMIAVATRRTAEINRAYAEIRIERGL